MDSHSQIKAQNPSAGSRGQRQGTLALYLHIPFCKSKCNYCDFNTYAGIESLMPAYVAALIKEIEMWGGVAGEGNLVESIFFGGGTPSLLAVAETKRILETCARAFRILPKAEVTLESNPGDLSPDLLRGLLEVGVNRLSIGVQSFHNAHLVALTRRHSAADAAKALVMSRNTGFRNINIDLMYGLPRQSLVEWQDTLARALGLGPEHLSLYALTLEKGTPLWKDVTSGIVPAPDGDLAADMYLHAEEALRQEGYVHYEISNWARPGRQCRHNLVYWENRPYLGMGAGAHSYYRGHRFSDERGPRRYIDRVEALYDAWKAEGVCQEGPVEEVVRGVAPIDMMERIDERLEMGETMMLGLRLMEGVKCEDFARRFGRPLKSVFGAEIEELAGLGLLEESPSTLRLPSGQAGSGRAEWVRLTPRGRLLGNEVFSRFVSVKD